jgi:hypothetical protein
MTVHEFVDPKKQERTFTYRGIDVKIVYRKETNDYKWSYQYEVRRHMTDLALSQERAEMEAKMLIDQLFHNKPKPIGDDNAR